MPNQVINVVTDYYADNTGGQSCFIALQKALDQAVADGGGEIYFPHGTYRLSAGASVTPLHPVSALPLNNVRLFGQGATIVCDTPSNDINVNGAGGGFSLSGNRIVVDGLSFRGFTVTPPSTDYGYGRLLLLIGNQNTAMNCHFAGGNGGAVEVRGDYNTITRNVFDSCNNHPPNGGDYGAIQIMGPGKYNTVSENKIVDHAYSGISAYGTGANNGVAYLDSTMGLTPTFSL